MLLQDYKITVITRCPWKVMQTLVVGVLKIERVIK